MNRASTVDGTRPRLEEALERRPCRLAVERRSILERDSGTQMKHPDAPVGVRRPRLRQHRNDDVGCARSQLNQPFRWTLERDLGTGIVGRMRSRSEGRDSWPSRGLSWMPRARFEPLPDQRYKSRPSVIDGHPPIRMLTAARASERARHEWEACGLADQVAPAGTGAPDSPRTVAPAWSTGAHDLSGGLVGRCPEQHRAYTRGLQISPNCRPWSTAWCG